MENRAGIDKGVKREETSELEWLIPFLAVCRN